MPPESPTPPPSPPVLPPPLPTLWMSPFPPEPLREDTSALPARPARPASAGEGLPSIPPWDLWAALSNRFRWELVLRMAAGEWITAPIAARGSRLRIGTVRKHLGQLRTTGVVLSRPGADRRAEVFYLPSARQPQPGVLDFGSCQIILPEVPAAGLSSEPPVCSASGGSRPKPC